MIKNRSSVAIAAAFLLVVLAGLIAMPNRGDAQAAPPFVAYPSSGWVPYATGPMVEPVVKQYGPNPLQSECAFTPPPVQSATGTNSCLDAHSGTIVASVWGTSVSSNGQATPGPYGAGLGGIDVYLGGPVPAATIFHTGATSSGGVPYYQGKSSDPLYCVPNGTENFSVPSHPGLLHVPAGAIPSLDSGHHLSIFDTTTGIHWQFGGVGIPSDSTNGGCVYQNTAANILPWATPVGAPPPDNSAGASDAYQMGTQSSSGTYPTVASASSNEGLGFYTIPGGISNEWAIRPTDILAGRIPHAVLFTGSCDTEANPSSNTGLGTYVYPAQMNRTGYNTDNAHFCADNTKALLYGAHIWLDEGPQATSGTDGCDAITFALVKALNEFGGYKDQITTPIYCSASNSGCSGDSAINFLFMPDQSDTYTGNLNCGGGTAACTDTSTNPSPWYQIISGLATLSGGSTGAIFQQGGTEGFTFPASGNRYQLLLPGQSFYQGSAYQNTGGTGANLNVSCGVNLASHMHVLIAPQGGNPQVVSGPSAPTSSVTSMTFANNGSAAQTANIADPLNTTTLTATSDTPVVATASISSGTTSAVLTVTPQRNGTANVTVSNGTQSIVIPITVTAELTPTASYSNATPGSSYPVSVTLPVAAYNTFVAVVNCPVNTSTGNGLLGVVGVMDVIAGQCNASADTGTSSEAHTYDIVKQVQAVPSNDLAASTSVYVAAVNDGQNLHFITCALPNSTNDCVDNSAADTVAYTPNSSVTTYIGSDVGQNRQMGSGGWIAGVAAYAAPLPLANINVLSAAASATDPYTVSTAYPAAGWVPYASGGPLQNTVQSELGSLAQITGNGANCKVTSSGYGSIQQTVTVSGTTYNTCLHVNNTAVISQLSSDVGSKLGDVTTAIGTGTYFYNSWNTNTHTSYSKGPSVGNAAAAFYVATSSQTATMGLYTPKSGCSDYGSNDDFNITLPMSKTASNAIHVDPNWIPQLGPDSHLVIRDLNTGIEWIGILSGIPTASAITTNGGYWPSEFYPYGSNAAPGAGCGTQTYATPGTVADIDYTKSHGINISGTAGEISLAYGLRPEEVLAGTPTHALTFYDYCDTNSGGPGTTTAYVNYPSYGYGDNITQGYNSTTGAYGTDCGYFTGGNSKYVDYGGWIISDKAPAANLRGTTNCNILEWFYWDTAYLYGFFKNDVTTVNYTGEALAFNVVPDSVDSADTTNITDWKNASAWYKVSQSIGDTPTIGSSGGTVYHPQFRNPSCGLSVSDDLMYVIPPVNKTNAVPAWGYHTR